ncbi:hypothetical protein Pmani_025105 [Petrolisthes manimaculis]|uniref:Uncharacterized protein n=1 Tax=Petrolisthes manimaculis TaxID=1843537 RepID=A0AAE1P684_9EUCA|nr:hypothetical protein Pmani_025105 [Petrolisthes manimaculis]
MVTMLKVTSARSLSNIGSGAAVDKHLDVTVERELLKNPNLLREVLNCMSVEGKTKTACYQFVQHKQDHLTELTNDVE